MVKDDMYKGLSPSGTFDADVKLLWLLFAGKATIEKGLFGGYRIVTNTVYTDKAIDGLCAFNYGNTTPAPSIIARLNGVTEYCVSVIDSGITQDHRIYRASPVAWVFLGYESIDFGVLLMDSYRLSVTGTTIKSFRSDMGTPKISVTDTNLADGYFGGDAMGKHKPDYTDFDTTEVVAPASLTLRNASSPSPIPVGYFEMPIIGSGSQIDPFRVDVPANAGLSASFFIPCDNNGKPKHGTSLVRFYDIDYTHPKTLQERLDDIKNIPNVTKLKREDAIKKALVMDDKLHKFDLEPLLGKPDVIVTASAREYMSFRQNNLSVPNVQINETAMKEYVKEEKW